MADDFTSQLNSAFGGDNTPTPPPNGGDDFTSQLNSAFGEHNKSNDDNSPAPDTRNPFVAAVADVPSEIKSAASSALGTINDNLNPFSTAYQAKVDAASKNPSFLGGMWDDAKNTLGTAQGVASIPALIASPVTGAARSLWGHTETAILPGLSYEQGKADADQLMMAMGPGKGKPVPSVPDIPTSGFGVIKSAGQTSGDVNQLQNEYAAVMGNMGPRAQKVAQAFVDQQKSQLDAAQGQAAAGLSPTGDIVADTPQAAGATVSQGMQNAAQASKANVDAKYQAARDLPGTIDASAFIGAKADPGTSLALPGQSAPPTPIVGPTIGDSIKSSLSAGDNPVIIDDKLTPYASAMLQDLDNNASKLTIQNRADPNSPPPANQISGVSLAGVDQWRKRLVAYRNQAFQSGNGSDGRAASAVVNAFDDHIDNAVQSGLFSGNPLTIQAWNDARAANTEYKSTFSAGKNDPIGNVVKKILGTPNNPAATGNDVADFLYGGTGTNPSSLNVGVANRVKSIFGEQSPEFTAVKQGLFNRLTKPVENTTPWGSQKIANNVNKFMNGDGKEMANAVFTPAERQMIQAYGDLHQSLIPPPGTRNPSGTSPFVVKAMNAMGGHIGEMAGATLASHLLPGLPEAVTVPAGAGVAKGVSAIGQAIQARKIAKQMPSTANAINQWAKAAAKAQGNYGPDQARSLTYASARLSNALRPFGTSLQQILANVGIQGPGTANANQNQNNVVRPPGQ